MYFHNIKELSRTSTYSGIYKDRNKEIKVEWEFVKTQMDWQGEIDILTVDDKTDWSESLERKLKYAIEEIDFGDSDTL